MKKVALYFDECFAGIEIDLHDGDFVVGLTEYQENKENSTDDHTYIEPRTTTEVYIGAYEIKSLIKALQYLLDENDDAS